MGLGIGLGLGLGVRVRVRVERMLLACSSAASVALYAARMREAVRPWATSASETQTSSDLKRVAPRVELVRNWSR